MMKIYKEIKIGGKKIILFRTLEFLIYVIDSLAYNIIIYKILT